MSAVATPQAPLPPGSAPVPHPGRLLVPALIALTLAIGASGLLVFRSLRQDLRHETERTLAVIAEQKRHQVEDWLGQAHRDARLFFSGTAQPPAVFAQWLASGGTDEVLLRRLRDRLADLAQGRGWDGLVLYDAAGRPVVVIGGDLGTAAGSEVPDLVRRPEIRSLGLRRNAQEAAFFALLAPVGQTAAKPLGAALIAWRADRTLFHLVGSWPVPTRSAETYLVERDGTQVRFLTPLRFAPTAGTPETRPLDQPGLTAARVVRGQTGFSADAWDYRGQPVLSYGTAITDTPWFLIAEIDRDEAEAGIRATGWVTGLVAGLGLLLVYGSGYLLWRADRGRREAAAETARLAAETRFRVIFEEAPLGMALVDARSGRIREANRRFADILGRDPPEVATLDWMTVTHPDDLAESRAHWERLTRGAATSVQLTKRYQRPDGSVVWVNLRVVPVVVAPGTEPLHLSMIEDVTERQRMEADLRLSEARHRLHAEHSQDIIWTMDPNGRYTYLSPAVERLQGFTPQEAMQLDLEQSLTPESYAIVAGALVQARADIAAGRPVAPFRAELLELCKDGSTIWTETTGGGIYDAAGRFVGFGGVTRDISERKRQERELREARDTAHEASRAKSDFLAHMSHELRTPLNGVLGLAQVLAREPLTPGQHEMVERIRGSGQSLLAILNEVLDLSRIEAGALHLQSAPFDLDGLLNHLEGLTRETARAKRLGLVIEHPEPPPGPLLGDTLRLEQVLQNLLGNAVKFTAHGGVRLRVQCRPTDAGTLWLRFEVEDSGIGIGPEALSRLFTPFTQADTGITRRFGGTGLGLAIAKRLVEGMGGTIGAESEEGHGSRFWFEIPANPAPLDALRPTPPPTAIPPPGPRLPGARLLVVEDSDTSRDLLERALRREGARVTLAVDGTGAIAALREAPAGYAAVLMDIQMPVMDGLTATRLIRADLGLEDLPVIALTAGVFDQQQSAALAAGVNAILGKPLDLERLIDLLVSWIGPAPAPPDLAANPTAGPDTAAPLDSAPTPPDTAPPDTAWLPELRSLLRENNLRALQRVETLGAALSATLGQARATTLSRAIRALRFAEALAILDTLADPPPPAPGTGPENRALSRE